MVAVHSLACQPSLPGGNISGTENGLFPSWENSHLQAVLVLDSHSNIAPPTASFFALITAFALVGPWYLPVLSERGISSLQLPMCSLCYQYYKKIL